MKPDEIVLSKFNSGYNCAESVLMAVSETLGLDDVQAQRVATGFGGGIARQGLLCGCLSGSVMAVGLAVGRVEGADQDSKELVYNIVGTIFKSFLDRLHTVDCRQLTGVDFNNKQNVPAELQRVHKEICCPLVSFVTLLTVAELQVYGLPKGSQPSA